MSKISKVLSLNEASLALDYADDIESVIFDLGVYVRVLKKANDSGIKVMPLDSIIQSLVDAKKTLGQEIKKLK